MDILKFINSKSIAKYLEEIKYEFNSLEAAYLVWQSKLSTMDEKFAAWEEIISTMPDMSVEKRRYGWETDEPSIHAFLRRYIDYNKRLIELFIDSKNAVYTYSVTEKNCGKLENDRVYTSLEICKKAVAEDIEGDYTALYSIKRSILNGGASIELVYNIKGEIIDLYAGDYAFGSDEPFLLYYFEGLWLKFPTPFKVGDIVYQSTREVAVGAKKKDPFVLTEISTWDANEYERVGGHDRDEEWRGYRDRFLQSHMQHGDESDMTAHGYFIDERGNVYSDNTFDPYLNMEIYDGKLEKQKSLLLALSDYIKGDKNLETLLNYYLLFSDELKKDHTKEYLFISEKDSEIAGLG